MIMTPEKYARIERERMEGATTVQSKTVYKAKEPRGYPSGKCQRKAASNSLTGFEKGKYFMEKMFLRVTDVQEVLGVSQSYAYKLMRKLNKELSAKGYETVRGRIDTKFFYEHFYQTKDYERGNLNAGI
jgi:hypothetical protein